MVIRRETRSRLALAAGIGIVGVGFGEVHELDPSMRVFTMGLIVTGCSSLIDIFGGFFQMLAEGELNRALGHLRTSKEIDSIGQHVIICGFGRIGRVLAKSSRPRT